ncbi:MAG: hypothetical protein EXR99_16970 [Gemmataceae bacterium]|nr:hypothetical protein [Gemmataceae bacterium]
MKKLAFALLLFVYAGLAPARDLVLIVKVGPTVQTQELSSALKLALQGAGAEGKLAEITAISPLAHHLLSEAGGTQVQADPFGPLVGPSIRYLMPEGSAWIVGINLGGQGRILEELVLDYSHKGPATLKLGKPGEAGSFWLATPGNYNLILESSESPVRYLLKARELGKPLAAQSGSWPAVSRFFALHIGDFAGDMNQVLRLLGDGKKFANPLTQVTTAREFQLALGQFLPGKKEETKVASKPEVKPPGKEEPKKPCVDCPPPRKGVFGFFRR